MLYKCHGENESVITHIWNKTPQFSIWFCTERIILHKISSSKYERMVTATLGMVCTSDNILGVNVAIPPWTRYKRGFLTRTLEPICAVCPVHFNTYALNADTILEENRRQFSPNTEYSFSKVSGYLLDNQNSSFIKVWFFSCLQCSDCLWIPSASHAMSTGCFLPEKEQLECETDCSHPSRATVCHAWSSIFTLHICLHGVIFKDTRKNLYFLFIHLCYSQLYVLVAADCFYLGTTE
jgi:hypothetical protein